MQYSGKQKKAIAITFGALFVIIAVGALFLFASATLKYATKDNKTISENLPAQEAEKPETGRAAPDGFVIYENDALGVSFPLPKTLHKKQRIQCILCRSRLLLILLNAAGSNLSYRGEDEFGNCFTLNVWQQSSPYEFNDVSTDFYRNESLETENASGTVTAYDEFGVAINTIQIPRYDEEVAGELIIQYSYSSKNYIEAEKIFETILNGLKASPDYVSISPKKCCDQKIPQIFFANYIGINSIQNNKLQRINIELKDNYIVGIEVAPDGDKIAFLYWSYEQQPDKLFSSYKTGVAIMDANSPNNITRLIEPGINAHTHLVWSPDSRYLSYIINDGAGFGMVDVISQKEIFRFADQESIITGPIAWINDKKFSLIYNGVLYLGSPDNPEFKIVAEEAINSSPRFESPPALYSPVWSPDGRYVIYRTENSKTIKDVETGGQYQLGETYESKDNFGIKTWSAHVIDWTKNNEFIFVEYDKIKLAQIKNNNIEIREILETEPFYRFELIEDGPNLALYQSGFSEFPVKIYNIDDETYVCQEALISQYYNSGTTADGDVFIISNPLIPRFVQWPNNSSVVLQETESIIELFNISKCESMGGFIL